jgi:hypothetical protein
MPNHEVPAEATVSPLLAVADPEPAVSPLLAMPT